MFFMTRQALLRRSRSCPSGDPAFLDSPLSKGPLHATSEDLCAASQADANGTEESLEERQTGGICAEVTLPKEFGEDATEATTLNTEPVRELCTTSKFDKRTAIPIGLDLIQGTENIIVADCANRKVKIFDLEENLKVECVVGRGYGTMREPVAACLNKQGHILVADKAGGNIKVFTSEGRLLTSFGRDLTSPRDICTSLDLETVMVADEKRKDVFLYTTYSAKCRKKLGEQQQRSLSFSGDLSVCSTVNNLLVYDGGSQTLYVFDSQGHFQREMDIHQKDDPSESNKSAAVTPALSLCPLWADAVACTAPNNHIVIIDTASGARQGGHVRLQDNSPSPCWSITSNRAGLMGANAHRSDVVRVYRYTQ